MGKILKNGFEGHIIKALYSSNANVKSGDATQVSIPLNSTDLTLGSNLFFTKYS